MITLTTQLHVLKKVANQCKGAQGDVEMALEMFQVFKASRRVKDFDSHRDCCYCHIHIISHYVNLDLQTLMLTLINK